MWKPDTNNQTMPPGVPKKNYSIQSNIKEKDCEVEKVMEFLKKVGVFEEI